MRTAHYKMDISSIPKVNSIVLTGLDYSMKPEHARFESIKGFIKPDPEIKVMHLIKSLAVMVYNQEKMTPYFHNNVCDGRNTLAYFICAVHRQSAPQPMTRTHSTAKSISSESSDTSTSSCKLVDQGKNCELPKLCTTSMLPLGYWDGLYYAVVAEIRFLREDLEKRYGFACELGNPTLHLHGPDGTTEQPITAVDLASLLETAWYALMDNRLVATLDDAVRMRNLRNMAAQEEVNNAVKEFMDAIKKSESRGSREETEDEPAVPIWPPPIVPGLIDVNGIEPHALVEMLWERYMPEINKACLEDFEDESMLTAYRADLHAREIEAAVAVSTPLLSAGFCPCHRACVCKLKCDKDSEQCTCLNGRYQVYHQVHEQESKKKLLHTKYIKPQQNVPNQFLGAATNTLAQMQIAALANPNPVNVLACRNIHQANKARERQVAKSLRERSNTNDSHLAYVPAPHSPTRGPKDVYPLNFYGGSSPQRYPRMYPQAPSQQSTGFAPIVPQINLPTRKPVPPPICTARRSYERSRSESDRDCAVLTPSSTNSPVPRVLTEASGVTYPPIPISQSQSMFTQSFPTADAGNHRDLEHSIFRNEGSTQAENGDPAQDYVNLLGRHPSTLLHDTQSFKPCPSPSQLPKGDILKKAATTTNLPSLKTLQTLHERPQPPLPQPDFIAPRPAVKQRYVSAGGNAKLSERAEIAGPPLPTSIPGTGRTVTKEEIDAKLNDPEFIRQHFGEAALGATGRMSPPRGSVESSKRSSGRKSSESESRKDSDKRNRTSSSASKRAKLMRVFSSRKNSNSDSEETR